MEAVVRPPIFALDREGWISVFDAVAGAEAGLEVPDVETGEYVALDAAGRSLSLTVVDAGGTGSWFTRPGPAVRVVAGTGEAHPELLRRALVEASSSAGAAALADDGLDSLVAWARTGTYLRARGTVEAIRATVGSAGDAR